MVNKNEISPESLSEPLNISETQPQKKHQASAGRFFTGCGLTLLINCILIVVTWLLLKSQGIFASWPRILLITVLTLILAELLSGIFLLGHRRKLWGWGFLTGGCCSFIILLVIYLVFIYSIQSLLSNL